MKATDVEIERRCGMVTGASCGNVTLSWIPGDGRNGTRSWVLATHAGDSIRRIRLSRKRARRPGGHPPIDREREEGTERQTMSTMDILGNTSEQADSIRLMLKVRGMKDGRFIDADPLIILKADNHQGSDRWDVYVSKTVYPTAESYGTLAGVLRMLADDVEIMAREKEMGGGQ